MKLNRDVLVSAVIKHQSVFFKLLDYIDQHDGALDIPENIYLNEYNRVICKDEDSNIHEHLSMPTLVDNGIFIHHDRGAGIITVERVIVDLLRFLDVKRAKELTDSDFEQMRSQLVSSVSHVIGQPINSQAYIDAMRTFNQLMSEVHSKIKENVHALTIKVDSLAIEYKYYDAGSTDISVLELYKKVNSLYVRFVLPCYEFINPSMDMIQTQSFSKSVQTLIDFHASEDIKLFNLATKIQLRKTVITSYYKDISSLTKKLEQFSSHLKADRESFLALEASYSQLLESLVPTRHGRKRNMYLTANSDIFQHLHVLDGLSSQKSKFYKKFIWDSDKTKLRFKEYLNLVQDQHIKRKNITLKPLVAPDTLDQERQILISNVLYEYPMPSGTPDVHKYIFDLLRTALDDFKLIDVLYGLEDAFSQDGSLQRKDDAGRCSIDDGCYYLNYMQIQYKRQM